MSAGHLALGAVVAGGLVWSAQAVGADPTVDDAALWVAVATGFAVAPDVDTSRSLVSRVLFPLRLLYVLVHRLLEMLIGDERADYYMRHRGITHDPVCSTPVVLLAGLAVCWWQGWSLWLAVAAGVGWVAHILGDWPTMSGVPFGLPWSERVYALGLFRVGSWVETGVVYPCLAVAGAFVGWHAMVGLPA